MDDTWGRDAHMHEPATDPYWHSVELVDGSTVVMSDNEMPLADTGRLLLMRAVCSTQ